VVSVISCWWLWYIFFPFAHAADIQASARISDGETQVGQPVRLDVIVQGARNAEVPNDIKIEGLRLSYIGRSMQVRMLNTQVASSATYTFSVYPLQAGNFIIPAFQIRADGEILQTQPLSLKVADAPLWKGTSRQKTPQRSQSESSTDTKLAFGILSIPKREAYVGEIIPVKVQYYFHPHFSVRSVSSTPSLIGEGFIVQKMEEPKQSYRETNGVRYTVLTFCSSISPLKAGNLQIPSASLICQVLTQPPPDISQQWNVTDIFFQRFFSTISAAPAMQKIEVRSDSATIQALPLPDKEQPVSFHGAIGNFALRVEVSTKDPFPGDPIILRAIISGKGNFEQIRELDLDAKRGWRSYPPLSKFKRLGEYGEKVFEWTLVPNVEKNSTPEVIFSYFNPTLKKYITLRTASQAVRAKPAAHSMSVPTAGSSSSLTEKEKWRVVRKFVAESYQPITGRPEFVVANGIAILALLAFVGFQFTRNFKKSGNSVRKVGLQHSLKASLDKASDPHASPEELYFSAAEFLRLWAQSASGKDMRGESAQEIVRTIGLVDKESELALEIFALHEELSYGFRRVGNPSIETRASVLKLLGRRRK
jgi:hypothetical protein